MLEMYESCSYTISWIFCKKYDLYIKKSWTLNNEPIYYVNHDITGGNCKRNTTETSEGVFIGLQYPYYAINYSNNLL